ncbi:MAG: sensor histidine kinase, partial [Pseudarthrobacter sp.]
MTSGDLFTIVAVVLSWALAIGAVTVVLQRLLRKTSIVVQILIVVLATLAILVAGMVSAFNAMFITETDLQVMWVILAIASAVAAAVAVLLGVGLARNTNRLVGDAARIGRGEPVAPQRKMTSELSALAAELAATSDKLEESRQREQAAEAARRELVTWVSHDLRTPLASMRA